MNGILKEIAGMYMPRKKVIQGHGKKTATYKPRRGLAE
jgi:hypothetical protein